MKGVVLTYRGVRKDLRGRYSEGSCILTPKGLFLWFRYKWYEVVTDQENSSFDYNTGECIDAYKFEPIDK